MPELPFSIGQHLTTEQAFEVIRFSDDVAHWVDVWQSKGFDSWEAWRRSHFKLVLERDLVWTFERIDLPLLEVPQWRGSVTPTWHTWAYGAFAEQPPRLKDLITNPFIANHRKIAEMVNRFNLATTVMALLRTPNGDTHVIEGMHRSCAIALRAAIGKPFNCELYAAIADWPDNEPPKLGKWPQQ